MPAFGTRFDNNLQYFSAYKIRKKKKFRGQIMNLRFSMKTETYAIRCFSFGFVNFVVDVVISFVSGNKQFQIIFFFNLSPIEEEVNLWKTLRNKSKVSSFHKNENMYHKTDTTSSSLFFGKAKKVK